MIKTEDIGRFALKEVVEGVHDGLGLEEHTIVAVHRLKHLVDVDGVQLLHDGLYKLLVSRWQFLADLAAKPSIMNRTTVTSN